MQHDGGQRIDLYGGEPIRRTDGNEFPVEPHGTEEGVIHIIAIFLRMGGFAADNVQQFLLGNTVGFAQVPRNTEGEQFLHSGKFPAVQTGERGAVCLADGNKAIHVMVGHIQAAAAALFRIHFKVGKNLFEGDLKRITDIMEERGQPPVLKKEGGGSGILRPAGEIIEIAECFPEGRVHIINCKAQGKDIDRMGIVIPVLHQKRGSV